MGLFDTIKQKIKENYDRNDAIANAFEMPHESVDLAVASKSSILNPSFNLNYELINEVVSLKKKSNEKLLNKITALSKKNYLTESDLKILIPYVIEYTRIRKLELPAETKQKIAIDSSFVKRLNEASETYDRYEKYALGTTGIGTAAGMVVGLPALSHLMKANEPKKDLEPLIKHMTKKYNLATTVDIAPGMLNSYFNPFKNAVTSVPSKGILAHELGHAANARNFLFNNSKTTPQKIKSIAKTLAYAEIPQLGPIFGKIPLLSLAGVPFATRTVHDAIADKKNPDSIRTRIADTMYYRPELLTALAVSPKLLEEGSASVRGLKSIADLAPKGQKLKAAGKYMPVLASAFGTYLASSAVPVGLAAILGHKRRKDSEILNSALTQQ